ncbi:MAG TPA: gliding motility-associated C-terminal domain-containing protein [Bacteroidia bacterium]|jgi:gliding motility-associated-like protein
MRKIFTLFSLILIGKIAAAQDVSVIAITAPLSGCSLSSASAVTISVKNVGLTDLSGVPFDLSYTINAGAAVTDPLVSFPSFAPNTTASYTFTTPANLSAAGNYTFTAYSSLVTDINNTNNATTGYMVTSTAPSAGGTVSGGTNVCNGTNSGTLTLSGHTGSVTNWEYSVDGGSTWISISNTTTSQSYNNLTVQTQYRAQVQNGACAPATSSIATMTIDPVSVGGTINGAATVCSGTNSGNLTSAGRTGNILKWQFSTDGGATWTDIANVTATQSYTNLTTTTRYRVQVQSGACAPVFSSVGIITVSPATVGGNVTGGTTVCSGTNSGTLTLGGHTGAITRWEFSTNGGSTWTNITNTTTTQTYTNLTATRYYRALVKSGACAAAYSTADSIVVTPLSAGGTLSSSAAVCSGSNTAVLTLSGYTGTIQYWESSTDGGATYVNIPNTTDTLSYFNLTATTVYRVNVKNGTCASSNSTVAAITVSPVSAGGTTASNDTVCSGANSGTITLSGHTGTITRWESSGDGITWNAITNTTTSQSYTNLAATTYYRAIVASGVCPADTSTIDTITVTTPTVGGTVTASGNICYGNNTGTLNLTGETGNVVRWEYSIDGGINWVAIANTATSYTYTNLTLTTQFRAVVKNGSCPSQNSAAAILTVDPVSAGGTLNGGTTACGGMNSGTLDLINYVGTILNWESSTDGGATWTATANTTASENYLNLPVTTAFRVIVQSGVCAMDTSSVATITIDPPTAGGTLSADDTVCAGSNAGVLTLSGQTGAIQHWESSTDGGLTWINLSNTTASQPYSNLSQTTSYRVLVKSGVCNAATSNIVTITVDPVAEGGTLNGSTTVCDTINSGTLTLSGSSGPVMQWESSTDGGLTWSVISNTSTSHSYTNLQDTTWYRVIISSGLCGNDTSSTAVINVNPPTNPGTLAMNDTVCAGANNGVLHLTGYTGMIQGWEVSTDGGFNWTPLSSTSDSLVYNNLNITTMYHAIVKSGTCNAVTSNAVTITVDQVAIGGTLNGSATVCDTINSGMLTLSGSSGPVMQWESSTDGGTTWSVISNTSASHSYSNLQDTTWYRVIISGGLCGNDTSLTAVINVNPPTNPGTLAMNDTVCAGVNNGVLHLTGYTGMIQGWEVSTDGGFNWTPLSSTSDSLIYNNLNITTMYHAIVKSGICNAVTSNNVTITVTPVSVAGMISGAGAGCEGANSGTLTVAGYVGAIQNWESSIDGGATWSAIANTTSTQSYLNLTDTTWYRVIVQSGICSADTSAAATVIVYPKPMAMGAADTVCFGTVTTFMNGSTIPSGSIQFHQWDFGDGNNSLAVNPVHLYAAAGSYNASLLTTSNMGCADTAMITVIVNAVPSNEITASGPLTFCSGDSVVLSAATGTYDYMWSTSDTTQSITVTTSGTYVVIVTDSVNGCSTNNMEVITVIPGPVVFAGNDTTVSLGSSITLNGMGAGVISWLWSPYTGLNSVSVPNPMASPLATTTYLLVGTDVNGCTDKDSVVVTVLVDFELTVSNVMTPNDDGYNDRFIIQNLENYPNTRLTIVNRSGKVVYKSEAYDNNWDGRVQSGSESYGNMVADGTYYYFVEMEGTDKVYKGAITVLRQGEK